MPLFTIERGPLLLTEEESKITGLKALLCSMFYPGMQWIRSFYDESDGTTRCFYVATSVGDLHYHADAVGVPCLDARPVIEIRPNKDTGQIIIGGADPSRDPEANDPELMTWVVRLQLDGCSDEAVAAAPWPLSAGGAGWLRTFIDREADELFSVFRDYNRKAVERRADDCGFETIEVRQMTQVLPADVEAATGLRRSPYGPVPAATAK